ncbi:YhjD/YihY/BrkB family envelope integrity protein [Aestuariimicrobium kwangyangense]|uniref:YhjD/YihY/BrkB family envelope integrity protein n=1 Tax=Aestuariimicrobium kwangyangense TaxID=396389 RepID=UPI0003B564E7|nr:YhjD/YihY/BrkB family envelope integrity protein [Aestuariimicrobium kwangyangense]
MKKRLERLMANRVVAHLMRARERYANRLGDQFAGAITYFSVLAAVPVMMFAFSMLGMTLTVLRPDWLGAVKRAVGQQVSDPKVISLIDEYLRSWRSVGVVGLLSLMYAGSGWVGNLRTAIRAQWRPEFENDDDKANILVKTLRNTGMLLALLLGVGLTFGLSQAGTTLSSTVAGWIGLDQSWVGRMLMRVLALVLTVASAWLLFTLVYWLLPREPAPWSARARGALMAAVAFTALQLTAGLLIGVFSRNKAAALFGPVIILMLFFNLFGRLVLLVGAWIATSTQPAVAFHHSAADEPLREDPRADVAPGHWELADRDRRGLEPLPAQLIADASREANPTLSALQRPPTAPPPLDPERPLRRGFALGVGAGAGLGMLVGWLNRDRG